MSETGSQPIRSDGYDLFISYSTDPDYALSRRIENFLESFHRLKVPADIHLKDLQVCRDGSDFDVLKIKSEKPADGNPEDYVSVVLTEYLKRSEYMLILCSHNAVLSKYVNFELTWFVENKGIDKILVALTEGADLSVQPELLFPKPVLENNLQTHIFYDLRGSKKESKNWLKVRNLDEELTKLAANLNGQSPGAILPAWHKEETRKLKRQRYISSIAAIIFLVLSIIAYFQRQKAIANKNEANVAKKEAISEKENVQKQLVASYWKNSQIARAKNNFTEAILYTAAALSLNQDTDINRKLLIDIEGALPSVGLLHILPHRNQVQTAVFSPDGKLVLTGCSDSSAYFGMPSRVSQLGIH